MTRIAFVVQRYGLEVCGGAELHCRWVAELMAKHCDVHVVTTCALNHLPWDNYYPEGSVEINGVKVHRFKVDRRRDHLAFDGLSHKVLGGQHTYLDEVEWVSMLGPHSSGLLQYIASARGEFDMFIFFTYQYFPTVFGMQLVPEKAALVPTAHDDPSINLDVYNSVFHLPKFIIYNTDTERDMVQWRFENHSVPNLVVGIGIKEQTKTDPKDFRRRHNLDGQLLMYVGRVELAKGCGTLLEYFARYKEERGGDAKLILMGKVEMPLPLRPDVVALGFVSDQEKFDGIGASSLVLLPSAHESLSMSNLEAWLMGVPVLANGHCQVLKDNCLKSNGGLYYLSYEEFAGCLDLLLADSRLRDALAANGRRYYEQNYSWAVIERKYLEIVRRFTGE